ncbi:MAG: HPr family phosphocarrier protein [Ruminococcaceae bacterium]|nr:HPr family phosphocarrier protein [Oscillospiraceae bacterium]
MSFHIRLTSFEQVKTFVALAARQPFDVQVGNERQTINGKDLMGMFCLDYSRPVNVYVNCSADEFKSFQQDALALQS